MRLGQKWGSVHWTNALGGLGVMTGSWAQTRAVLFHVRRKVSS
jgi:hypothetical protein